MKNFKSGFTLIELLVVVAIIGLLASLVVFSLGTARLKSRDARRLSDMQQTKTGLDIYYSLAAGYPDPATWNTAQTSLGQLTCSGTPALKVPQDPLNVGNPAFAYTYTTQGSGAVSICGTVYNNYKIQFTTEGPTSIGPAGIYYSSPAGFSSTAPF